MNPGEQVRLLGGGVHVFVIVDIEADHAIITAAGDAADAPGAYPFRVPLSALTPAP